MKSDVDKEEVLDPDQMKIVKDAIAKKTHVFVEMRPGQQDLLPHHELWTRR